MAVAWQFFASRDVTLTS